MNKSKEIKVYVDSSFKNGIAGIGIVLDCKGKITAKEYVLYNCETSNMGEQVAILKGIEYVKTIEKDLNKIILYTDNLGMFKKYKGNVQGVEISWIPRERNLAHEYSVTAKKRNRENVKIITNSRHLIDGSIRVNFEGEQSYIDEIEKLKAIIKKKDKIIESGTHNRDHKKYNEIVQLFINRDGSFIDKMKLITGYHGKSKSKEKRKKSLV